MENMRKIIPFLYISFHNLFRMPRFSRSFSVVFSVISGENRRISGENRRISEKNGEYRRKMENIGDIFPFSFLFFPLHYTFIPHFQISQILCSTTCLL